MNRKKVFFILSSLSFFFVVPSVFAADVSVVGRVGNPDMTTSGSKVIFKNSESQQVTAETIVDPLGQYTIYVPEGTYDVIVVPPEGSGLAETTKYNQEFSTDAISDIVIPSVDRGMQNNYSFMAPLLIGGIAILLVAIVTGYALKRKRK